MLRSIYITSLSLFTILTCAQKKNLDKSRFNPVVKTTTTAQSPKVKTTKTSASNTSTKANNVTKSGITETLPTQNINSTKSPSITTTSPRGDIINFKESENKFLKEYEMNVTFKQISEDSRCPKGVNCIWEGVAVADVELMGTYTRPVTVKLASNNNEAKGYKNFADFNGYRITLKSVTPYPTENSDFKNNQGKYNIELVIEKVNN